MKTFLYIITIVLILLTTSCAPKIRLENQTGYNGDYIMDAMSIYYYNAKGYVQDMKFSFNNSEQLSLKTLNVGEKSDYVKCEAGKLSATQYTYYTFDPNEYYNATSEETLGEYKKLKRMKKYTYSLRMGTHDSISSPTSLHYIIEEEPAGIGIFK